MSTINSDTDVNMSTETFVTALVTGAIIASAFILVFMIIRNRFKKVYQPRSYLVDSSKRVDPLPHGFFSWIPAIFKQDSKIIIEKNGLDAYVFVRFLQVMLEIFIPMWFLSWAVLLPVNAVNSQVGSEGVDMFTFGNIGPQDKARYAAHIIILYIFTFYLFYIIRRELATFVELRQDFLMSARHSEKPQSKTVLVTGVPKELLTTDAMTKFCNVLPGGVQRVWICRDLGKLPDVYDERLKACNRLESAETAILKKATKIISKENLDAERGNSILSIVGVSKRPKHKTGFLGLVGAKVDSIEWARDEIVRTNKVLKEAATVCRGPDAQQTYPAESAAFIQFHSQLSAHLFAQSLSHHAPLRMSSKYLEVGQADVIWSNLSINPYQKKGRYVISWAITIGLIILWAFPVAFVGMISNVSSLCATVSWMRWLCQLPSPVNGIISGSLPPLALAVLFMLVPVFLRLLAQFEGIPLKTQIELSLMTRYFSFLVIHGFLIVTLSSGLVAAIPQIVNNPGSTVNLLAENLPKASTFFLSYIVTTSLSGAAGGFLQIVDLIMYYVKLFILGSTPRSVAGIKLSMSTVAWGTLFPTITLITVITTVYSVISPLICGFASLAFGLYWFAYKYLFIWVNDTPEAQETGGRFYPKALGHIFVGMYLQQICMIGLFFLRKAYPQGGLAVVLICLTFFFQLVMGAAYDPLIDFLPLSIAPRTEEPRLPRLSEANEQLSPYSTSEKTRFPPPARKEDDHQQLIAGDDLQKNGELDPYAFDHPATYQPQRTVWIPRDVNGLYRDEERAARDMNIDLSSEGATMNEKGGVDVTRDAPEKEWDPSQQI